MQKTVFFHLYNDFSGSPMILRTVVKGFIDRGLNVELVTSRGGILDTIGEHENYTRHSFFYRFSRNPLVTIVRFMRAQLNMFLFAFRYAFSRDTVFFINTILPVGPAIAGKLMGKRVVYHCHENAWMKGRVYKELSRVMTWVADDIICVSDYQRNTLHSKRYAHVVPNAISDSFISRLHPDAKRAFENKNILMACSPKMYKGVREFNAIANRLPQYHFTLILNASQSETEKFLRDNLIYPARNITVVTKVDNMADYYNKASVVMNLSDRHTFIETFGMTIAEGLCAGLPCIVPTIGGVKELVEEGVTGYHINCQQIDDIAGKIDLLLSDETLYMRMSKAAIESSSRFGETEMVESIITLCHSGSATSSFFGKPASWSGRIER